MNKKKKDSNTHYEVFDESDKPDFQTNTVFFDPKQVSVTAGSVRTGDESDDTDSEPDGSNADIETELYQFSNATKTINESPDKNVIAQLDSDTTNTIIKDTVNYDDHNGDEYIDLN